MKRRKKNSTYSIIFLGPAVIAQPLYQATASDLAEITDSSVQYVTLEEFFDDKTDLLSNTTNQGKTLEQSGSVFNSYCLSKISKQYLIMLSIKNAKCWNPEAGHILSLILMKPKKILHIREFLRLWKKFKQDKKTNLNRD